MFMLQSHIVEIDGSFVGVAVRQQEGYRFKAMDVRLDAIDGRVLPSLPELQRLVRAAFFSGRAPRATSQSNVQRMI